MQEPPQKLLVVEAGGETNVADFVVRIDGTPPTLAEMRRLDPIEKQEQIETLNASPRRALGARSLGALRAGRRKGRVLLRHQACGVAHEMQARLRQAYEGASRFVRAEGEIDWRVYRAVLRARRLVTIKGAGKSFSGLYYVTRVRHIFTGDGSYTQHFEAYRNGVGLTGQEDFAAAALPIPIQPGATQSGRPFDTRARPAPQVGSTLPGGF
jgi:hypothetical protein